MADDLTAVFAEAAAKKTERDGAELSVGGVSFPLWPSRFSYDTRIALARLTGFTPNDLMMQFGSGSAAVEGFAAFIAMSVHQQGTPVHKIKVDNIVAWLEEQLAGDDPDLNVRKLHLRDGVTPDPGVVVVGEMDGSAGPE